MAFKARGVAEQENRTLLIAAHGRAAAGYARR